MQEFPDMIRAYAIRQLDVCLVFREVHDSTTTSNVENRLIIFPTDRVQAHYFLETFFFRFFVQEFLNNIVAFEFLRQTRSS